MFFKTIALAGLASAATTYYSQADGQIIGNPTSTTGLTPLTITVSNGVAKDQSGRTCYIVTSTNQLQCSSPVITQPVSQTGFSVVNGLLAHNGNTAFFNCETTGGQQNNFHVYQPADNEICFQTTVPATAGTSSSRAAAVPAGTATVVRPASQAGTTLTTRTTTVNTVRPATTSTKAATPVVTTSARAVTPAVATTAKAATTASSGAPSGNTHYPRLIIPVVSGQGAQGTSYDVVVSTTTTSDLVFDVAYGSTEKQCTLVGYFPTGGSDTSNFSGSASVCANLLSSNANLQTSSSNQPSSKTSLGCKAAGTSANGVAQAYVSFPVSAGNSYTVALSTTSGSIQLFEDYNPPTVGYAIVCS